MNARDLYTNLECGELVNPELYLSQMAVLNHLPSKENRLHMFRGLLISDICKAFVDRTNPNDAIENRLLKFEPEWMGFVKKSELELEFERFVLKRFIRWIESQSFEFIEANVRTTVNRKDTGNIGIELTEKANLIVRDKSGIYHAFIIKWSGKDFNSSGRKVGTATKSRLDAAVLKMGLETKYPGIQIDFIRITRCFKLAGKSVWEDFTNYTESEDYFAECDKTHRGQACNYDDTFNRQAVEEFSSLFDRTKELFISGSGEKCYKCFKNMECSFYNKIRCNVVTKEGSREISTSKNNDVSAANEVSKKYPINKDTSYTERQLEVINNFDGPAAVLAGPGTGKTATVVERCRQMIASGISANNILIVTFTNKAAEELRSRMGNTSRKRPTISTLNALGQSILNDNEEIVGKTHLLTDELQASYISEQLDAFPTIRGLKYCIKGDHSTISKVKSIIIEYEEELRDNHGFNHEARSLFHKRYGEKYDSSLLLKFIEKYECGRESRMLITYDEQKRKAAQLLEERSDIRNEYLSRWKYVMVDEFQDINDDDWRLLKILSSHRNIVVVGDDDQNLYAFRGSNPQYLRGFEKHFPDCKKVILDCNFRCSKEIWKYSDQLIRTTESVVGVLDRIAKDIHTPEGVEDGNKPVIHKNSEIRTLYRIISGMILNGYSFEDIAIIASKNATLEEICRNLSELGVPCQRSRIRMSDDWAVGMIRDIIYILENPDNSCINEKYRLSLMFGVDYKYLGYEVYKGLLDQNFCSDNVFEPVRNLLETAQKASEELENVSEFIRFIASYTGLNKEPSIRILLSDIMDNEIEGYPEVVDLIDLYKDTGTEKKVDFDTLVSDSVQLLTMHDSKGMQFPCVIVADAADDESNESLRASYVAATRAEKELHICFGDEAKRTVYNRILDDALVAISA